MAESNEILEGFLCPICKDDLKCASQLTSHFQSLHQEDQDVLRSLKDIFGKAKKIILNNDDIELKESFEKAIKFSHQSRPLPDDQVLGVSRSHTDYFKGVRSFRMERYATETNKLLIRLHKLVTNMPSDYNLRRQHEQEVVPWLDGTSVKLCPNCAKSFNITKRKHHCRLCGSILCHDCSMFLDYNCAKSIVDPSVPQTADLEVEVTEKNSLRLCEHCYKLIDLRKQVQDSANSKAGMLALYDQMKSLLNETMPLVEMHDKMYRSLIEGEAVYTVGDANAVRARIGRMAEKIDGLANRIAAEPAQQGSRAASLHAAVRRAATVIIKENILSLPKVPTEAEIEEIRRQNYENAERKIRLERERRESVNEMSSLQEGSSHTTSDVADDDNPLLEQMNIIRGYIREARKELRFEEVVILEANLKELKKEYQMQKLSNKS